MVRKTLVAHTVQRHRPVGVRRPTAHASFSTRRSPVTCSSADHWGKATTPIDTLQHVPPSFRSLAPAG
eukprot:8657846-Alexandrium_andersonii.AAC.1